jgi:hypothetical protein
MTRRRLCEVPSSVARHRAYQSGVIAIVITLALLTATTLAAAPPQDKKLKPEELISRHLESIGKSEATSAAKSRVASGAVTLTMRVGGAGNLSGEEVIASTGPKLRINMKFPSNEYSGEDLAYDGAKVATGILRSGNRSRLSAFLSQQDAPLKEGLLGGVLSTAWPLLRFNEQQPRLEYKGLKKVGGRELHEISYRPRKGSSELKIVLHFDPATFRHVRTQYSYQIGATVATRETPNANPESYYSLIEEFDDFREADGLMLPYKYRVQLSVQSGTASALFDYNFAISRISHNESLDEKIFTLK